MFYHRRWILLLALIGLVTGGLTTIALADGPSGTTYPYRVTPDPATGTDSADSSPPTNPPGYDEKTMQDEAGRFFGQVTEGLARAIEKAFREQGKPNAYIKGQEVSVALVAGMRYGDGQLTVYNQGQRSVHWQGPSLGWDAGLSASKVFILIYGLPSAESLFQRFPGVEGSLYYIAGVGMTYLESDRVIIAPIRLGVGMRVGANIGYLHFTRTPSWVPF